MRRRRAFLGSMGLTVSFGVAALEANAQAKAPASVRPAITWCEKPASNPEWARRVAYLTVGPWEDTMTTHRAVNQSFPVILSGIAQHFIAARQPARNPRAADPLAELPQGEPRYGPEAMYSGVRFDLLGDGSVDSIRPYGKGSPLLRDDLTEALLATIAEGKVFGPYADPAVRTSLFAGIVPHSVRGSARWPAFSLEVPLSRGARSHPDNTVKYPEQGLGWRSILRFSFEVDEEGRVVPESIHNHVPPDSVEWDSNHRRVAYESFAREVETGLKRLRYEPAEEFGCRVSSRVQQEFHFEMEQ